MDDGSRDTTVERAAAIGDSRVEILRHERNRGVGAAIVTGYKSEIEERMDITCVMAADNQMDPADLESVVQPVLHGEVDYSNANPLVTGEAWR